MQAAEFGARGIEWRDGVDPLAFRRAHQIGSLSARRAGLDEARERRHMNKRVLSTVAIVAAALALFGGIWGLVDHQSSGDSEGAIEEMSMWIAIDLILLSVSALASALAARSTDDVRPAAAPRA